MVPAGVRMVYPSCLVLLPLSDLAAVVPQGSANPSGSLCGAQQGQAAHRDPAMSSVTLTPPTSPEEAQTGMTSPLAIHLCDARRISYITIIMNLRFIFLCIIDYQPAQKWLKLSSAPDGYSSNNSLHGGKIPRRLASQMVESVWQEYNINRTTNKYVENFSISNNFIMKNMYLLLIICSSFSRRKFTTLTNGTCEEESDKTGLWDFVETTHRPHCNCARYAGMKY